MKRKTQRLLLVVVLLVLLAVAIWIAVDDDEEGGRTTSPGIPSTTSTALVPTTVPQESPYAALAAVIPEVLDGYRIDTGAKATGSLDLNAAVAAESDQAAERALLETRHFEAGYARAFTNNETDVYMAVYDFKTADDARLYAADGIINLTGKGAEIYEIPEITGARGFSQGTNDQGRPAVVHGVVFSKNDRFSLIFTRAASTSTPARAKDLALSLQGKM
jgi:hypothetical protein